MPRRFLIGLLAFGAIGGFASGFASLSRHHHWRDDAGWGYPCGSSARAAPGKAPAPAPESPQSAPPRTPAETQ
jgi:hypothetical protein